MTGEPPVLAFHTIRNANIKRCRIKQPIEFKPGVYSEMHVPVFDIACLKEAMTLENSKNHIFETIKRLSQSCVEDYLLESYVNPKSIIVGHTGEDFENSVYESESLLGDPIYIGKYFILVSHFEDYVVEEIENA